MLVKFVFLAGHSFEKSSVAIEMSQVGHYFTMIYCCCCNLTSCRSNNENTYLLNKVAGLADAAGATITLMRPPPITYSFGTRMTGLITITYCCVQQQQQQQDPFHISSVSLHAHNARFLCFHAVSVRGYGSATLQEGSNGRVVGLPERESPSMPALTRYNLIAGLLILGVVVISSACKSCCEMSCLVRFRRWNSGISLTSLWLGLWASNAYLY